MCGNLLTCMGEYLGNGMSSCSSTSQIKHYNSHLLRHLCVSLNHAVTQLTSTAKRSLGDAIAPLNMQNLLELFFCLKSCHISCLHL